jgi:CBS domain-containing protein
MLGKGVDRRKEADMTTHASTVREAMTAFPTTISKDATVVDAARLMVTENVGSLPVVRGSELVGIVTDRDLVAEVLAKDLDPNKTLVADVCSEEPTVASPDEPLHAALQQMASEQVRRLPVVEDGRLVGILAQADVAREAEPEATGELVEEISEG